MFGYSKQAYYKRKSQLYKSDLGKERLASLVMTVLQKLPKTRGKKLYFMLKDDFKKHEIKIGRDKYLLVPRARRYYKTANSRYWMRKYPN